MTNRERLQRIAILDARRSCHGWGGRRYSYDPSPAGVSLASGSICAFDSCKERGWNYDNGQPK
jgi:hypothetical protein